MKGWEVPIIPICQTTCPPPRKGALHWITMQSTLRNEIKIFSLIILLGILLYAHHLHHPFQFDSLGAIKENPRLNDPTQLLSLEFFVREYFDRGLLQVFPD